MSVLEIAEIKWTRSSSEVLIFLHVKQVFTAAVAGSIRESQLTGEVQMTKTREGRRTLKSHLGQKVCDVIEKKIQGKKIIIIIPCP